MVSQILNFGLPAPIDVHDCVPIPMQTAVRHNLLNQLQPCPRRADLRIQQAFDRLSLHPRNRPDQGGGRRIQPKGHCRQPADFIERELPDHTHILAESEKWVSL